jgi:hypothetical protein
MNRETRSIASVAASAAALMLVAAAAPAVAQEKPSGTATASETRTATVTKIDAQDRWVTLKLADGTLLDVEAGPEVKNFSQIKVGDKVVATQQKTVSVEVLPAGQAAPNATGGTAVTSAPPGAKPMGIVVDTVVVSGKVTAIDHSKRTVTLQGPAGNSHNFVVSPDVKKFDAVKLGDVVVMTIKSATSIEVQSPK